MTCLFFSRNLGGKEAGGLIILSSPTHHQVPFPVVTLPAAAAAAVVADSLCWSVLQQTPKRGKRPDIWGSSHSQMPFPGVVLIVSMHCRERGRTSFSGYLSRQIPQRGKWQEIWGTQPSSDAFPRICHSLVDISAQL